MERAIFSEDRPWREGRIAHVHISDCAANIDGHPTREPLQPGEGMIDIAGFIGSLLDNGYEGLITLESPCGFHSRRRDWT
jgi:sugar phosphate isomerase/epimerase